LESAPINITMNIFQWLSLLLTTATTIGANAAKTSYATIPNHSCFRSMQGMMESMSDLANANPDIMTMEVIGESYLRKNAGRTSGRYEIPEGGHDIYALKITDSKSPLRSNKKGRVLLTAGLHAREYAPPELLARFVESLVRGYDVDAGITSILQRTEIHAILYVNPDGRWMAEKYPDLMWRKNLNPNGGNCGDDNYGVDINRNFNFVWGKSNGASSDPCDSDYHGPSPESEPETQALVDYSKKLFPSSQRKNDPEGDMHEPFGEGNVGIYADIHASGGYVYYPWGHKDSKSPDDEALQALGRKINSFNGYKLWAGGQPDFVYPASGDASDYEYGVMGVASLGFEIGEEFYEKCNIFNDQIVTKNLPALLYTTKLANAPFKLTKGPDILDASVRYTNDGVEVSATASDSEMVNAIGGSFSDFRTGDQDIAQVMLFVDEHPDDASSDAGLAMSQARRQLVTAEYCSLIKRKKQCKRDGKQPGKKGGNCRWYRNTRTCGLPSNATGSAGQQSSSIAFNSGEEDVHLTIDQSSMDAGRHTLYIQATDSDGYKGPVHSMFVEIPQRQREGLRGAGQP